MGCDEWLCFGCMRVMVLGRLGGAVQLQTSRNMINFFRDVCINGLRGDGWLKSARSRHWLPNPDSGHPGKPVGFRPTYHMDRITPPCLRLRLSLPFYCFFRLVCASKQ